MHNNNLITVLLPSHYFREHKGYCPPKIKKKNGRSYYTVRRRCRVDDSHRARPVKVFIDTLGEDGLKEVFDNVSNLCLVCGALD